MTDEVEELVPRELDPWARFGWIMSAVWLFFLVYPLVTALTTGSVPGRILATLGILAFAITYLRGFILLDRGTRRPLRIAAVHLPVMLALVLLVGLHLGLAALGMLPFVVALAMFTLPMGGALLLLVGLVTLCVLAPWIQGERYNWIFAIIVAIAGGLTAAIRVVDDRARAYQDLRDDLAVTIERERVARDVHDVLGHSLTVVTVKAELAQRLVEADPERARAELEAIRSLSREALAEIRATVAGLRVARLADELERATQALADSGIVAEVGDDPSVVDPRHRIVVAWVLREAVTNVVRHSGARRCVVELASSGLQVTDDGRGIADRPEGNGLRGARERVVRAGGTLTMGPGPDGVGTRLRVVLG